MLAEPLKIRRVFLPSALRRGRLQTSPAWFVMAPDGVDWKFYRKRDAVEFIDRGGACPDHRSLCSVCHGHPSSEARDAAE